MSYLLRMRRCGNTTLRARGWAGAQPDPAGRPSPHRTCPIYCACAGPRIPRPGRGCGHVHSPARLADHLPTEHVLFIAHAQVREYHAQGGGVDMCTTNPAGRPSRYRTCPIHCACVGAGIPCSGRGCGHVHGPTRLADHLPAEHVLQVQDAPCQGQN
jgi:hypothetical protein